VAKRARHDLPAVQEKRALVVELRAKGLTWDQIAQAAGYSNGSAASKAWHVAIRARPDMAVDKIRDEAATRYEYLFAEAVKQIDQPGPRVSAIGKVALYPDGHEKAGQIVEDEAIRARAIDNARKATGDYIALTGAALAPSGSGFSHDQIRMMAEVLNARADLSRQAPAVPLAALPAGYSLMSPAEQAAADLDRRRRALQAQRAASRTQSGDDDIVEAEIVD
jgi:hypothetical protein